MQSTYCMLGAQRRSRAEVRQHPGLGVDHPVHFMGGD